MRRAFLVGAGISVDPPANFPTAWQLSSLILGAIAPTKKDLPFLHDLIDPSRPARKSFGDYIRFEQLLESVAANLDGDLAILRYFAKYQEPNGLHSFLARRAIADDVVITTNFDGLLEEALLRLGSTPVSVIANSRFRTWKAALGKSEVPIFKLHGSFDQYQGGKRRSSFASMQATLAAVARGANVLSLPKEKALFLRECLQDHELWVVGYSGSDDLDIMPSLCGIDCAGVVWIEHDGRSKPEDVTAATLRRLGGLGDDELGFRDRFFRSYGASHPTGLRIIRGPSREILGAHLGALASRAPKSTGAHLGELEKHFTDWHLRFASKPASRHLLVADLLGQIGMLGEAKQQIELAWSLLEPGDLPRSKASFMMSRILVREGSPRAAAEWSLKSVRSLGASSTAVDRIRAYHQRGYSLYKCGRWKSAQAFYFRAESLARSIGSYSWLSIALHDRALILQDQGSYQQAVSLYKQALRFSTRSGDIQHASWSLYQLAVCYYEQARFAESIRYLERSAAIAKTIGDANHVGFVEQLLGLIDILSGDIPSALRRFRRCLEIDRRTGYSEFSGMDLLHLGIAYLELGRLDRADKLFQLADLKLSRAGDEETRAELRSFQAQLALEEGDVSKATDGSRQAIELANAAEVPGYIYRARCISGLTRWKAGDPTGMVLAGEALMDAVHASLMTLVLDLFCVIRRINPSWKASGNLVARLRWARRVYRRIGNRSRSDLLR